LLTPAETLAYAQDLLDRGLAFNAHEVLEAAWKNGPVNEQALWQGLAQLAVGITHVQRGNVTGAITLLRRASARLAHDDRVAPYGIDAANLVDYADALIADLAERSFGGDLRSLRAVDSFVPLGPASSHVLLGEDEIVAAARRMTGIEVPDGR
jgi:hypothetical protein